MPLLNDRSLARTLANLTTAQLEGRKLPQSERDAAAGWIASRMGRPGSYRGLPAPTERDRASNLHLFTGEAVNSRVGVACKLGFEGAWALTALRPKRPTTVAAAALCRQRTIELFRLWAPRQRGRYCCYSCSVAGWRALGAAPGEAGELLRESLAVLRASRDGEGRWRRFPYWYTLLALIDIDHPDARAELAYAGRSAERALAARSKSTLYDRRRRQLAQRALETMPF